MRKMFHFLFWVALVLGVVIGIARATAIRWWRVPADDPYLSASISPNVAAGDLILLWRLTNPRYGDLALCKEPKQDGRVVIGRIIGESNDDLEVSGSDLTINHKRQVSPTNCPKFTEHDPGTGIEVTQRCSDEDLGDTVHMRGDVLVSGIRPPDVQTTVPPGTVWLVSDNRQYPYDSRDFGPVERQDCTEKVFFRLVGAGGFFDTARRNTYIH